MNSNLHIKEVWKQIPNYEGHYEVSSNGKVKSLKYNKIRILKPIKRQGYYDITLSKNGKCKTMRLHRIVLLTFKGTVKDKPEGNHLNGNKLDNNINNLEWCTRSENTFHAIKNGLQKIRKGINVPQSKLNEKEVIKIRTLYKLGKLKQHHLADMFNVTLWTINQIINYHAWKHI